MVTWSRSYPGGVHGYRFDLANERLAPKGREIRRKQIRNIVGWAIWQGHYQLTPHFKTLKKALLEARNWE